MFPFDDVIMAYIDGLVQERRNFSALAMELRLERRNFSAWAMGLRLSCTNPSIWGIISHTFMWDAITGVRTVKYRFGICTIIDHHWAHRWYNTMQKDSQSNYDKH